MPTIRRVISESGYYHLVIRGNGRQIILEERSDYIHFLHNLKQYSTECGITVNAFCLMENHVHLLIYDKDQNVSMFMKRLAGNYALWFNKKYDRSGHLFENRYTGRPIKSDIELCRAFRYILNNPKEAGICPAADYLWSSYNRYGDPNSFVDTSVFVEFLGDFKTYAEYISTGSEDDFEFQPRKRDDEWAKEVMRTTLKIQTGSEIRSYNWKRRNEAIRKLREQGLSIRQIERLTGISKSVIQRA